MSLVESVAAPASLTALPSRSVLLLQGLMGPMFRRLGQRLMQAGHTVHKVNFNGGDRVFWRLSGGIDYCGTLEDWPAAFTSMVGAHAVTDVMLFGDCRDHHMAAIRICRDLGVAVHVFEEGYIRPDWVTMERGGVNGNSSLPRDPDWYRRTAASLPPVPEHRKVLSSFRRRAIEGLVYNLGDVLSRWHYPHWSNHRPWHPLVEGAGWSRKLLRQKARNAAGAAMAARIEAQNQAFFLFPLQLDSDAQIRMHSPFVGIADALKAVLGSFAAHAAPGVRLVVKEHPLDNGVRNWEQETRDIAERFGVADRVDYLAFGDIERLARLSRGIVTINSTTGTLGLAMGVPVVVLGHAVYDIADITFQDGLDAFWQRPVPPDPETFAAFRRVLIETCLIPGGFFSDEALGKVVEHAVARFEGRPLLPE
ncbi:capsular polysaccharide biosynthesis protein [Polymorphobacter multimanifer]|uniref:Capsular polysaccharide export protein n=1 Tax=Polymorphobacter multimanifer TaxID=1070431 RepID=A0A841LEQ9_9SPHN|nr:capsular biosynthesis protein [Polymorphobacter multimanifer]MBB6228295.1 capsular polysaccharide export protein [Polymorphobacter multimanifer]GGI86219.1 capsular polysaccharide biosynthesis protein [Polymorphobacter multimanifer]